MAHHGLQEAQPAFFSKHCIPGVAQHLPGASLQSLPSAAQAFAGELALGEACAVEAKPMMSLRPLSIKPATLFDGPWAIQQAAAKTNASVPANANNVGLFT
jgi:hypothetical protein